MHDKATSDSASYTRITTSPTSKIVRDLDSALTAIRHQYSGSSLPEFFDAMQYLRTAIVEAGYAPSWEAR
jgi:hypothetical protein